MLFRKFKSARLKITDMKSFRKEITAAALAAFSLLCFSAAAQQEDNQGRLQLLLTSM